MKTKDVPKSLKKALSPITTSMRGRLRQDIHSTPVSTAVPNHSSQKGKPYEKK